MALDQESANEPQESAPETAATPSPAETEAATPQGDPIVSSAEEPRGGLLARLNPLRMFRKRNLDFFIREGRDLLETGSYAQATVAFNRALAIDPQSSAAYRGLGKVHFKKGGRSNLDAALKHYQEAIRLAPRDHDLYAITAKIYDALGKRKEATLERKKFVIVRALEADANNAIANNNMGILFLQQGQVKTALEYFRKAIRADRHFDVAHRNMAATYYQQAKQEQSAEKRNELIERARNEVDEALKIQVTVPSLLARARILLQLGDADEALAACSQADEMDPANKDIYLLKKVALERLGRFEESRNAFESYQVFMRAETQGDEDE